jgi:hypothetical protein
LEHDAVHVVDRSGRHARPGQGCIEGREIGRPEFLNLPVAKVAAHMIEQLAISLAGSRGHVDSDPIGLKSIKVRFECRA